VYEEPDGTEEPGSAAGAVGAAAGEDVVGEEFAGDDVAGDDVVGDEVSGDDVAGVNDGLRFRGVKIDSRSCPAPSVLGSSFADGLSSVTDGEGEGGEGEGDEAAAVFGFPIRSAGSGGTPPFAGSSLPLPLAPLALPLAAGALATGAEEAGVPAAGELPLSSGHDGDPLRDEALSADPDCEPPALVRDGDMMPLSATASSVSTSGSMSRTGGAIINGVRVVGPASSTPSSSVLTVPLRTFA
jgi:hypothetical protein